MEIYKYATNENSWSLEKKEFQYPTQEHKIHSQEHLQAYFSVSETAENVVMHLMALQVLH